MPILTICRFLEPRIYYDVRYNSLVLMFMHKEYTLRQYIESAKTLKEKHEKKHPPARHP